MNAEPAANQTDPAATVEPLRHGLMQDFSNLESPTEVWGFDYEKLFIPGAGTAFGFVWEGHIDAVAGVTYDRDRATRVKERQYFSLPFTDGLALQWGMGKGFVAVRRDYAGLPMVGGPVESKGRLRYIDGCSDTLIIAPPIKGDPCFNLLHFPAGINQTSHTHPSVRCGLIHGGEGVCHTAHGSKPLLPGSMFILFPDAIHAFSTEGTKGMDLTVYHPETDFGPSHEEHPMLNRTTVDGVLARELDDILHQGNCAVTAKTAAQVSTGRIRKKAAVDANVLDLARHRVREAYRLFDTVVVSFSGGKDSTCVLHLAIDTARELKKPKPIAFFYDEEAISLETVDYVRRVAERGEVELRWYCLPIQHRNGCTRADPYWYPWAPEDEAKWVRPLPPEAITWDMVPGWPAERDRRPSMPDSVGLLFPPEQYGRVGMMMGIRSDESITRTRAILMSSPDSRPYIRQWDGGFSRGNLFKVMPIYDWRTGDVWTAPRMFGWDYNRSYDLMEMAGIPHSSQRCAPPYGEEPMRGLWMYAVCFPAIWDKMQSEFPGAATAARYSQTELYSFKSMPPKPADMTWEEFLRYWIEKHPPKYRGGVAKRVVAWINNHHNKTTEPLAVTAPHPETGVFWNMILRIAVRGDYKDRQQVNIAGDRDQARARYDAEIEAMRAAGQL